MVFHHFSGPFAASFRECLPEDLGMQVPPHLFFVLFAIFVKYEGAEVRLQILAGKLYTSLEQWKHILQKKDVCLAILRFRDLFRDGEWKRDPFKG